jgi:hypothetical protein
MRKMFRPTALNKDHWPRGGRLISTVAVMLLAVIISLLPDGANADAGPVAAPSSSGPSLEGVEIRARLSSTDLQVGGVRLNRWLVWRLYAAYGFEPIWGAASARLQRSKMQSYAPTNTGLTQICFMRR